MHISMGASRSVPLGLSPALRWLRRWRMTSPACPPGATSTRISPRPRPRDRPCTERQTRLIPAYQHGPSRSVPVESTPECADQRVHPPGITTTRMPPCPRLRHHSPIHKFGWSPHNSKGRVSTYCHTLAAGAARRAHRQPRLPASRHFHTHRPAPARAVRLVADTNQADLVKQSYAESDQVLPSAAPWATPAAKPSRPIISSRMKPAMFQDSSMTCTPWPTAPSHIAKVAAMGHGHVPEP